MAQAQMGRGYPVTAGAVVGTVEIAVTFPLEFVKRQMQLQQLASPRALNSAVKTFHSPWHCATLTLHNKGLRGLYAGFSGWVLFAGPRSAIRFGTFDALHRMMPTTNTNISNRARDSLAGLGAGMAEAALAQTPNQAIAVKMIHDQSPGGDKRFTSFAHAARCIYAEYGIRRGFFCGLQPALVKGASTNMIRFCIFNSLKRISLGEAEARKPLPPFEAMCAGAFAGAVSAILTQPVDTVMAMMQGLESEKFRRMGLLGCGRALVHAGGVRCLFHGMTSRLLRVSLEVALQFSLFEQVNALLVSLSWGGRED